MCEVSEEWGEAGVAGIAALQAAVSRGAKTQPDGLG